MVFRKKHKKLITVETSKENEVSWNRDEIKTPSSPHTFICHIIPILKHMDIIPI